MSQTDSSMADSVVISMDAAAGWSAPIELPTHLVPIPGQPWAFWSFVGVRGAGFAASLPARLGAARSAALADDVVTCDTALNDAYQAARGAMVRELRAAPAGQRAPVIAAIRRLKKNDASFDMLNQRLTQAWHTFRRELAQDSVSTSQTLRALVTDDRFREAMLWQNRRAVSTAADLLLQEARPGQPRNSKQRKHEELLAGYLQRYCLKNDTIGFFGPMGWATLSASGPALTVRPGPSLLATRNVYFEVWGIDALADALAKDARFDPWLTPRLACHVHLEDGRLLQTGAAPAALSAADAALLRACDGETTIREIARRAIGAFPGELTGEQDVLARLRAFRDRGWLTLTLPIPSGLWPERGLARALERIEDDELRTELTATIQEVLDARARVARAAGDVGALEAALVDLDARFERVTGREATRLAGKTYAARTLVFEDCRRDAEIELGGPFVDVLGPPLALLLESARWLTWDTARRFLSSMHEVHQQLTREAEGRPVDLAAFLDRAGPILLERQARPAVEARDELRERWTRILAVPDASRRVAYRAEELRAAVLEAFQTPKPGWQSGRYHSPDVMIAARSIEDVRHGDYQLVLGELHAGANTLGTHGFLAQHPHPGDILAAADYDLPEPRLEAILPKDFWVTSRTRPRLISPKDYRLQLSDEPSDGAPSNILPIATLVVVADGQRLTIRTRDGRIEFDLIEVIGQILRWRVASQFAILPPRAHTPRITFDRLVVVRESWSIVPTVIEFAVKKDEPERFVAARRWMRDWGLPRRVFAKSPLERKPFYVDFDSPIYVEILAKAIRRCLEVAPNEPVTVTEMLPDAHHSWLIDAHGTHYTSELRMVAIDLRALCETAR